MKPIENGDIPASYVSLPEGKYSIHSAHLGKSIKPTDSPQVCHAAKPAKPGPKDRGCFRRKPSRTAVCCATKKGRKDCLNWVELGGGKKRSVQYFTIVKISRFYYNIYIYTIDTQKHTCHKMQCVFPYFFMTYRRPLWHEFILSYTEPVL